MLHASCVMLHASCVMLQRHGLEHAEFVIKDGRTLAEFVDAHSTVTFDQKAMKKAVNADVSAMCPCMKAKAGIDDSTIRPHCNSTYFNDGIWTSLPAPFCFANAMLQNR